MDRPLGITKPIPYLDRHKRTEAAGNIRQDTPAAECSLSSRKSMEMLSRGINPNQDRRDVPNLTKTEAAEILGISERSLHRLIAAGDLPAYRLGRRAIRIRRDDLDRLFEPVRSARSAAEG